MKKIISLTLCATCAISSLSFVACNGKEDVNASNVLKVYALSQGYGHEWLDSIAASFKEEEYVKQKFPDLEIKIDASELESSASTYITSGEANPYDVLFGAKLSSYMRPNGYLADLTQSVLEAEIPGEVGEDGKAITLKNKIYSKNVLDGVAYADASGNKTYYSMPYQMSFTGVVYNATKLDKLGLDVPRTTNEWINVMNAVKSKTGENADKYKRAESLITYGGSAYLAYLLSTWWGQYEGATEYLNFYNGYDSATGELSPNVLLQDGRLEALKALEAVAGTANGFCYIEPNVGRATYMNAQTRLLTGDAIFMANGTWFNNEMKTIREGLEKRNGSVDEVKFMRTPVVSAIINKTPTIKDDKTLSAVIAAIDEGKTEYPDVSSEDFAIVKEARRYYYGGDDFSSVVIPKSTKKMDLAVEFVKYLATDKALGLYVRDTDGCDTAFTYDVRTKDAAVYEGLSAFQKDRITDVYDQA